MTRAIRWTLIALSLGLCACEEDPGPQVVLCAPNDADWPPVSTVLEKRCGTLDCHGNLARPFRLYGNGGLRVAEPDELTDPELAIENGTVAGGKGTTPIEYDQNWRSLCGLEPEKMSLVQQGELAPTDLLIMRKPLGSEIEGGERHKGGQLFNLGGAGYVCLESWIDPDGGVVLEDCATASKDL